MSNNTTVLTPPTPPVEVRNPPDSRRSGAGCRKRGARALPIYQTTSFVFAAPSRQRNRFALAELGPIYTRLNNPTQGSNRKPYRFLEGGVALLASGQAAITYAILNIAGAGDHVVASPPYSTAAPTPVSVHPRRPRYRNHC